MAAPMLWADVAHAEEIEYDSPLILKPLARFADTLLDMILVMRKGLNPGPGQSNAMRSQDCNSQPIKRPIFVGPARCCQILASWEEVIRELARKPLNC